MGDRGFVPGPRGRGRGRAGAPAAPGNNVNMYGHLIISSLKDIDKDNCWTVAIAETVEAHYNQGKDRTLQLSLSPQFLADYVKTLNDSVTSFKKSKKLLMEEGMPTESAWPYRKRKQHSCPERLEGKRVRIGGAVERDEEITEAIVLNALRSGEGPVVAVFNTDDYFATLNREEIYEEPVEIIRNGESNLEKHAVVIVGYGTHNNRAFWTIRNNYGSTWCLGGYGRISRNVRIHKLWYPEGTF